MGKFRFLALPMVLLGAAAFGGVIVQHPLLSPASSFSSQNDTTSPGGLGPFSIAYDSFTLAAGATISEIDWFGDYFNPATQGTISQFTIKFYDDSSGIPGSAIGSIATTNFHETADGFDNTTSPRFRYAVNGLSLSLAPGTYWISIVADLPFPPQWGWDDGSGGDGNSYQTFFGSSSVETLDRAFTLLDTAATPEPATMGLIGLGLAGLGLVSPKRTKR